ncbi:hypothetical protein [Nesterenkonia pannonica]|uniref:glutamate ligase domain-containing protein n=1 Tax=Nesterenkonia pannonica TaxID=1548602 RepID=UPI0021644E60|nr:cyanophycin synthetase [Nesterenkonia pannonica]
MERIERADGVTIINDAYNANPESMREALKTLARLAHPEAGEDRRSVAVLGAMLELGDEHNIAHIRTGETVVRLNIDRTLVVGDDAYPLYRGAVAEGSWDDEVNGCRPPKRRRPGCRRTSAPATSSSSSHRTG